jgi:hypothetical protein
MHGFAFEGAEARELGKLDLARSQTGTDDNVLGRDRVAPVRSADPAVGGFVPGQVRGAGLEQGAAVEIVLFADTLAVCENFGGAGVLFDGDVAGLFEEGEVDVLRALPGRSAKCVWSPIELTTTHRIRYHTLVGAKTQKASRIVSQVPKPNQNIAN